MTVDTSLHTLPILIRQLTHDDDYALAENITKKALANAEKAIKNDLYVISWCFIVLTAGYEGTTNMLYIEQCLKGSGWTTDRITEAIRMMWVLAMGYDPKDVKTTPQQLAICKLINDAYGMCNSAAFKAEKK
jgi:hypothetical protein